MLNLLMKYFVLFLSMIIAIAGQVLLKKGITNVNLTPNIGSIITILYTPALMLGFFSYGVSAILWLFVLKNFPLSVAYPSLSLTYVFVVFLSSIFFGENVTLSKIIGVVLIFGGVFFINRS